MAITGCQLILYFQDIAIFSLYYICPKFPILHPKILYFSKTMRKKVEALIVGIISLAPAPVHVTDFPIVNVHVDELSARIWQYKLCVTLSASVNINYHLPIKVFYRICTLRHIRIKINHGSQNVFWVLTWVGGYK